MTLLPRWREHPAARAELRDAALWYDGQEIGLGGRFADEVTAGVTFIRTWPEAAPRYRARQRTPQLRRKTIDAFPYGIVYFLRDDEVIVVAYAHEKRRPGYWRKRLNDFDATFESSTKGGTEMSKTIPAEAKAALRAELNADTAEYRDTVPDGEWTKS